MNIYYLFQREVVVKDCTSRSDSIKYALQTLLEASFSLFVKYIENKEHLFTNVPNVRYTCCEEDDVIVRNLGDNGEARIRFNEGKHDPHVSTCAVCRD